MSVMDVTTRDADAEELVRKREDEDLVDAAESLRRESRIGR